jgi:hypothetical protein
MAMQTGDLVQVVHDITCGRFAGEIGRISGINGDELTVRFDRVPIMANARENSARFTRDLLVPAWPIT